MNEHIDPTEIRSIKSSTPVTITFDNGESFTAYNFIFEDVTHNVSREDESWEVTVKDDL